VDPKSEYPPEDSDVDPERREEGQAEGKEGTVRRGRESKGGDGCGSGEGGRTGRGRRGTGVRSDGEAKGITAWEGEMRPLRSSVHGGITASFTRAEGKGIIVGGDEIRAFTFSDEGRRIRASVDVGDRAQFARVCESRSEPVCWQSVEKIGSAVESSEITTEWWLANT
jgi:hypothetical protein